MKRAVSIRRRLSTAVGGFDTVPTDGRDAPGPDSTWSGAVWINTEGEHDAEWTREALNQLENRQVESVYCLLKGDSSTKWWHEAAAEATAIAFIDTRLSFSPEGNCAPFPSHIVSFGPVAAEALDMMDHWGLTFIESESRGADLRGYRRTQQTALAGF